MELAVVGATGFVGKHLVPVAQRAGHQVRVWVRRVEAVPRDWAPSGVRVCGGSILPDAARAIEFLRGAQVLIFLAAAGVQSRDRVPDKVTQVNLLAPSAWLSHAAEANVSRIVVTGTCLEYRGFGTLPHAPYAPSLPAKAPRDAVAPEPLCNIDTPLNESDLYAASKAAGGVALRALARHTGMPLWYLRLASLYGPGDDPNKILPAAIDALGRGQPFAMSPGAQLREWLHVDDAAAAILAAAGRDPRAYNQQGVVTLNVGTGAGLALGTLVRSVAQIMGADLRLVQPGKRAYRQGEVHHLVMDVSGTSTVLGVSPPRDVATGLRQLLADLATRPEIGPNEPPLR